MCFYFGFIFLCDYYLLGTMFAKYSLDCRFICIICLLYLFNCMCFIYVYMNIFLKANKDYYYYYHHYNYTDKFMLHYMPQRNKNNMHYFQYYCNKLLLNNN